jgi:hypothetical protein
MSINISDLANLVELNADDTTAIVGGTRCRRGCGPRPVAPTPLPTPVPAPVGGGSVSVAGLSQVGGAGLVGTSLQTASASSPNGGVAAGVSTGASLGGNGVSTNGSGFGLAGGNVSGNFNITGAFDRT